MKDKFRKLQTTIVIEVNPVSSIDFLFQENIISANDMRALVNIRYDPQQQCRELLTLLHRTQIPQAFVTLEIAIKRNIRHDWLVTRIAEYKDEEVIQGLQQLNIDERRGRSNF